MSTYVHVKGVAYCNTIFCKLFSHLLDRMLLIFSLNESPGVVSLFWVIKFNKQAVDKREHH